MKFLQSSIVIGAVVFFAVMAKDGEVEDLCTRINKDPGKDKMTLTVFNASWKVETPTNISPDLIRKFYSYQYVCNPLGSTQEAFLKVVSGETLPQDDIKNLDCRWLLIVTDASGQEKLTMYVDSFFSRAVANGIWFKPNRKFKQWVNHMFGNAFELEDIIKED